MLRAARTASSRKRQHGTSMSLIERLTADFTTLKGALRTLRMTTPIAKHPTRVFPQVVLELADTYGDAPALLSATGSWPNAPTATHAGR
jgi:hypothetical protein